MNAITPTRDFSPALAGEIMETVLIKGDLRYLTPAQRVTYHDAICQTAHLNPLTRPFAYIELNGKLTLYALKACTDQLRQIHGVSISILSHDLDGDLYTVHVKARDASGREDEDFGVVVLPPENRAQDRANAILRAVTKAKRRVTLSICGLGFLDETEVEDIPAAAKREAICQPEEPKLSSETAIPSTETAEVSTDPAGAVKPKRRRGAAADRKINDRYEETIKADEPRRAFERPAAPDPDAERATWDAEQRAEEFLRMEHELQSLPTLDALNRWTGDNHARIAQFSDGEKNGLRMAWANKKASLQPHSLSQKAMAARGPRYAAPDDLEIPRNLRRYQEAAE
jgi:hypothetical protein